MPRAVQDRDVGHLCGQLVGDLSGAVGGVVVDDQGVELDAGAVGGLADAREGVAQVLALVVGGEDDDVHAAKYTSADAACRETRRSRLLATH